jgi:hypothetical protein
METKYKMGDFIKHRLTEEIFMCLGYSIDEPTKVKVRNEKYDILFFCEEELNIISKYSDK